MVNHQELWINGYFLGGPCDTSLSKQVVHSPWDGHIVGVAAEAGTGEVDAAIEATQKAFLPWSRTSAQVRQTVLRRIAQSVQGNAEEWVALLANEIGKPITFARAEVARASRTFELAAQLLDKPDWDSIDVSDDPRANGVRVRARREAIGPIFCITPYNWPVNLAAHKLAPALAAGNTVILKGSPQASLSTLFWGRVLAEAELPDGIVNIINCEPHLAEKVALDDRVKMVSFTGSPKVGWHLKQLCWKKRVLLELGGNAPTYVDEDFDFSSIAKKLVQSAFGYAGQVCISAQNVYAHFDAYEPLLESLVRESSQLKTGDPNLEDTVCGPMISEEAAERVLQCVQSTQGKIETGGTRNGSLVQPTLISSPNPSDEVVKTEVFGPILTIQRVDVASLAIVEMNRSPYGLQAAVFTNKTDLADKFVKFLQYGGVVINDVPSLRFDAMPYGGVKESGFGREGVRYAFEEMTEWKTVILRDAT